MRTLIVKSAQYWFDAALKHIERKEPYMAAVCLENALNHTENAVVHLLEKHPEDCTENFVKPESIRSYI